MQFAISGIAYKITNVSYIHTYIQTSLLATYFRYAQITIIMRLHKQIISYQNMFKAYI